MTDLKQIVEIAGMLKGVPIKTLCGILSIVLGLLLFVPAKISDVIGLKVLCESQRSTIGLSFMISVVTLIVLVLIEVVKMAQRRLLYTGKDAQLRLDSMSVWARGLIRQMYESDTRALKLPLQNANVAAMVSDGVLMHAQLGDAMGFECVLQPWVVTYLNKHPDYLKTMKHLERPYSSAGAGAFGIL